VIAHTLSQWGWDGSFAGAFDAPNHTGQKPARVVQELRGAYLVQCESGELPASISGRLRHEARDRTAFPTVGDWIRLKEKANEKAATILSILPRRSKLSRKISGEEADEQLIAANVDTVFIVHSLADDFNARRMERYLSMVADSGATAVILLTKADLSADPRRIEQAVREAASGVAVLSLSVMTHFGLESLGPYFAPGQTCALVGSSGAGKSTLVNQLVGSRPQTVQAVREDDQRGRHTTSSRHLFLLPTGGIIIDTPGMRVVQSWESAGVEETFADIVTWMTECRYGNCQHGTDGGCAVQAAILEGRLSPERYAHYLKLGQENNALLAQQDAEAALKANWKIRKARLDK